ncbi:MAG: ketoacyl-ACP synthase III [Deltaproteobacteria bacterium]|nr:ketoacyl-ACP synthase III [Deltaproteobacteria bacterium]
MRILGTGSYVPDRVLSNFDLEKTLDTTNEWIHQRTGILERRVAAEDQASSDLAHHASLHALDAAGIDKSELDLVIFATITPDMCCPAAANFLQAKLDIPRALTFDVSAACSGFIFALNVAQQYLKSRAAKTVLVVASEVMTRTVDWTDRSSCILWGDGAAAVVLRRDPGGPQLLSSHVHTDGANGMNLLLPGGGSLTTPIGHRSVDEKRHFLRLIAANTTVRVAVKHFADSCYEALEANHVSIEDIDWVIPHQANLRMLQSLAKRIELPMEKMVLTIEKYGNISSASVAIALDEAVRDGRIRKDHLALLTAFGGGLTWGSALIRW